MRLKKSIINILVLSLVMMCLSACGSNDNGNASKNGVELTADNINEYLQIETTYEKDGTHVAGRPVMKQTVKIYPIKGGSFNNTEIILSIGNGADWELQTNDSNVEVCKDDTNKYWYGISYLKIVLPANGEYEKSFIFNGEVTSKIPSDKTYKFEKEFTDGQRQAYNLIGDDTKPIKGTFVE